MLTSDNKLGWLPPDTAARVTGYEERVRRIGMGTRIPMCAIQINGDTTIYILEPQDTLFGMGDSIFRQGDEPWVRFIDSADATRRVRELHTYPTR
ncbi:MAG TPA: hypothetical protein VFH43_11870 [Candidatus Kapabacteria bacterium]|nr:hypothetical protein [Candidatus Kapabacteria bacterium]